MLSPLKSFFISNTIWFLALPFKNYLIIWTLAYDSFIAFHLFLYITNLFLYIVFTIRAFILLIIVILILFKIIPISILYPNIVLMLALSFQTVFFFVFWHSLKFLLNAGQVVPGNRSNVHKSLVRIYANLASVWLYLMVTMSNAYFSIMYKTLQLSSCRVFCFCLLPWLWGFLTCCFWRECVLEPFQM